MMHVWPSPVNPPLYGATVQPSRTFSSQPLHSLPSQTGRPV